MPGKLRGARAHRRRNLPGKLCARRSLPKNLRLSGPQNNSSVLSSMRRRAAGVSSTRPRSFDQITSGGPSREWPPSCLPPLGRKRRRVRPGRGAPRRATPPVARLSPGLPRPSAPAGLRSCRPPHLAKKSAPSATKPIRFPSAPRAEKLQSSAHFR